MKITTYLLLGAIGLVVLSSLYIGAVTPIQAKGYELTNIDIEHAVEPVLSLREHVWRLLTEEGGLTFDEAMTGMMIIGLESSWNVYAIGDNGQSHGLWQIHEPSHPNITRACKFDVYCSTRAALEIYEKSGWYPWSTYKLIK